MCWSCTDDPAVGIRGLAGELTSRGEHHASVGLAEGVLTLARLGWLRKLSESLKRDGQRWPRGLKYGLIDGHLGS
jgi:hypothetical protein